MKLESMKDRLYREPLNLCIATYRMRKEIRPKNDNGVFRPVLFQLHDRIWNEVQLDIHLELVLFELTRVK